MSKYPTFEREQRVVRVFVSSTFRDMHAERDELIKRTFPQLRKLCAERGVTLSDVDLRWALLKNSLRAATLALSGKPIQSTKNNEYQWRCC